MIVEEAEEVAETDAEADVEEAEVEVDVETEEAEAKVGAERRTEAQAGAGKETAAVKEVHDAVFTATVALRNPKAGELKVVQKWMTKSLALIDNVGLTSVCVDKHDNRSIGTRKPDCVHYLHICTQSTLQCNQPENCCVQEVANIVAFGEMKGRRGWSSTTFFTLDEKAAILDFAAELGRQQPWRQSVYCYLCDGIYIQFFNVVYDQVRYPHVLVCVCVCVCVCV